MITALAVIIVMAALARTQLVIISKLLLSYFPVLGWIEIAATLLVALGCCGELWLLFSKEPDEQDRELHRIRRWWERMFMMMVAVGVTVEVPCLMISLR